MADPGRLFDMRLGLAVGKLDDEIRAMPYPQYRRYQLFYMLEPWGWHDKEERDARALAMLHNVNVWKLADQRPPKDYIRDLGNNVIETLLRKEVEPNIEEMTVEERKALVKQSMKEFFGV